MDDTETTIWDGQYKIPWHEPGFSRRMLREHLSQEHDLASRTLGWIDRQVEWIHRRLLEQRPARVLDLGCGPGLYSHRLAALGHTCLGIDFGPASIEHAGTHTPPGARCRFELGDLRESAFGGSHDLAMILYGELNVFSPNEAASILGRARASLAPGGALIAEVQSAGAVEAMGNAAPSVEERDSGVFADGPYRCRTECRWLAREMVAVQTFEVTEVDTGTRRGFRSTTKAWTDAELGSLLADAGFASPACDASWPTDSDALQLWVARCPATPA